MCKTVTKSDRNKQTDRLFCSMCAFFLSLSLRAVLFQNNSNNIELLHKILHTCCCVSECRAVTFSRIGVVGDLFEYKYLFAFVSQVFSRLAFLHLFVYLFVFRALHFALIEHIFAVLCDRNDPFIFKKKTQHKYSLIINLQLLRQIAILQCTRCKLVNYTVHLITNFFRQLLFAKSIADRF